MLKYDLHTHTSYSKCSNMKPYILLKTAKKRGLNGIAVTDHNTIDGALAVKKLNNDKNFEVIIGEEVTTTRGDVLAYYLQKPVNSIDFFKMVEEVRKQNGLIVIPHPFRTSINPMHKFKLPLEHIKGKIDAVECFNARTFLWDNKKANEASNKLGIAKTAGSDAHFKFEVASAFTLFEGDLRKALKNRKTKIFGTSLYGPFFGLLSFLRKRALK
ncbi:PHP domain-containing protein [Candidatus Woesearchaeota archaeon]|nr:PHP domain-containing protein [Candidatus Woesearchaeota archaeon]